MVECFASLDSIFSCLRQYVNVAWCKEVMMVITFSLNLCLVLQFRHYEPEFGRGKEG